MMKKTGSELLVWLNKNNIKGVLLDFDDTIIKTNEIFRAAVQQVVKVYAQMLPQLAITSIEETFSRINIAAHGRYSVNPDRWKHVITQGQW